MLRDLTKKEIRFCEEYLISFNATEAAIKAGYSKNSASSIGSENLRKPKVIKYLEVKSKKTLEKLEISQERTIKEIARIAYADPRKMYNEDGTLKRVVDMDDDTAPTIASCKQEELFEGRGEERMQVGVIKEVKQWNKPEALNTLAKIQKLYADTPPPPPTINVNALDKEDLKNLLLLKKKIIK